MMKSVRLGGKSTLITILTLLFLVNVNLTGCSKTDRYPKNRKGQKEFTDEHPPQSKKGPEPDSVLYDPVPYNPDTIRDQELKILGFELPAVVITGNEVQFSVTLKTNDNKKERITLKGYTEQDNRFGTGLYRALLQDINPSSDGKQRLKAIAVCLDGASCQSMFIDVRYMINGVERKRQFSHIVEAPQTTNPNEDEEIPDHDKFDPNDPNNAYTGHRGEFVGIEPFDRGEFLQDLLDRRLGDINIPRYSEPQVPIVTLPKDFIPELLPKTTEDTQPVNPNVQPPAQQQPQASEPFNYPQPQQTQPTAPQEQNPQPQQQPQEEPLPIQPVKPQPVRRTPSPMEMPDSDIYPEGYKRPAPPKWTPSKPAKPVVEQPKPADIPMQPVKPAPQQPTAPVPPPKINAPLNPPPPPPPPKVSPPEIRGELSPRPQIQNPIAVLSGLPSLVLNLISGGKADGFYGNSWETDVNNRKLRVGRLIDASEQALEGIGFKRSTFPQSHVFRFGTGLLVDVLTESAREFRRLKGYEENVLFINHISKEHGGSNSGHGSHQNGLDVDIAYLNEVTPTAFEDQTANVRSNNGKFDYKRNFLYWAMMINTGYMHVVFVSNDIKYGFCRWAKSNNLLSSGAEVLRRLFVANGHHNHFHMRMKCSPNYPTCQNQKDLIPKGKTGCESYGIQ